MKLILASKSSRDSENPRASSERLVNLYPVPAPAGADAEFTLREVPGTRDFATVAGPFARAAANVEGTLYVVSGGGLHSISEGGVAVRLATIPDDPNTAMVGHRGAVTIAADGGYFHWDGTSMTQPSGGRLVNVGSVAFLDQFTILGEQDGREVEWTAVGDPTDRNGLYFKTTEARDDLNIRAIENGAYLWVLKQRTTELWASTGDGPRNAFARVPGGVIETGLLGFNLVCKTPAGLFGVGHDRCAHFWNGMAATPVSTPAVDQALKSGTPTHCFYFEDRGHRLCAVRFGDRPAWVYDAAMGAWHERASGTELGPWDVVGSVFVYGQWHLISRTGRVYRLGQGPWDATGPMRRTCMGQTLYLDGDRFTVRMLELVGSYGRHDLKEYAPNWILDEFGLPILDENGEPIRAEHDEGVTELISRPQRVWLRFSKDGGMTWPHMRMQDVAMPGQYRATARFRALGQYRQFTPEINMTDPAPFGLLSSANVEAA